MLNIGGHVVINHVPLYWQMHYTALGLAYSESAGGRRGRPIKKNIPGANLE